MDMGAKALTDEQIASRAHWRSVHIAGDRGPLIVRAPVIWPFWKPQHELRALEAKSRG